MGLAVSFRDFHKYEGKQYMPKKCLKKFPSQHRGKVGSAVICFKAAPPGYQLKEQQPNLIWIVDCQFVPNEDNHVVTSVGVYQTRPPHPPLVLSRRINGLLAEWHFKEKLKCSVIRGSSTSAYPQLDPHPNGVDVVYVGTTAINIMDLDTLECYTKQSGLIENNYRHVAASPDGYVVAGILRRSLEFDLVTYLVETAFSVRLGVVTLGSLSPGFQASRLYTEEVECKFSPDSSLIAACSSEGSLVVIKKTGMTLHCGITPALLSHVQTANARVYDFDPRYCHRYLAFASRDSVVYICDIETAEARVSSDWVVNTEGTIDTLRYHPNGESIAVATSEAVINLYSTESLDLLYQLDCTQIDPPYAMLKGNNLYPNILRLSFSSVGDHLAVSATDGIVRIFQLCPVIDLRHLCRQIIKEYVPVNKLTELPLPPSVIMYLLEWPVDNKNHEKR